MVFSAVCFDANGAARCQQVIGPPCHLYTMHLVAELFT